MATKRGSRAVSGTARKTRSSKASSANSSVLSGLSDNGMNYFNLIQEWSAKPIVRYMAGGIAVAVLTRLATNLSGKYPEISAFLKENLDIVEGRLTDFKNSFNSEDSEIEAHH